MKILAVDIQEHGANYLISEDGVDVRNGSVTSLRDIILVASSNDVEKKNVLIDCGYKTAKVLRLCHAKGYTAVKMFSRIGEGLYLAAEIRGVPVFRIENPTLEPPSDPLSDCRVMIEKWLKFLSKDDEGDGAVFITKAADTVPDRFECEIEKGLEMIPILIDHDITKVIGKFEIDENGAAFVVFSDEARVTRHMFFDMMGVGAVLVDLFKIDGIEYVKKARIVEFSVEKKFEVNALIYLFSAECCVIEVGATVSKKELYASYCEYAKKEGDKTWSAKVFDDFLRRSFQVISVGRAAETDKKSPRERVYFGIRLKEK